MAARGRATRAVLSFICAVLAVAVTGPKAQAEAKPTQLSSTITLNAENVATASGRLSAGDQQVPSAPLTVSVNGAPVGEARTSSDGTFSTQVDLNGRTPGDYTVGLGFAGTTDMAASASSIKLTLGAAPGQLNASSDPALAAPGQLVTVTGTLLSAANAPVANGRIIFAADNTAVPDAATVTGADGTFSTFVLVPESYTRDSLQLTALFTGDAGTGPTSSVLPISVVPDTPATPSPSAQATGPATTVTPNATAQPTTQPTTTATPKPTESATSTGFPWWLIGLAGIAALAAGVTSWVLIRERRNRQTGAIEVEGGLLDSFSEEDNNEPPAPPRRAAE